MIIEVHNELPRSDSYAAERTRGLYNVDPQDGASFRITVDLPVDENDPAAGTQWQIGVVVGPSGSGKSSILRQLREVPMQTGSGDVFTWDEPRTGFSDDGTVIEDLTKLAEFVGYKDPYARATAALASVGLGSVPSWLRPRSVLSMGEGFRADMAWLLITENEGGRVVLDEFTSVLDRQVAQVGAAAFAKSWRRQPGRQIILFTCHYDVLQWLQPDWVLDTQEGLDQFAEDRGVVPAREGDFRDLSDDAVLRKWPLGELVDTLVI